MPILGELGRSRTAIGECLHLPSAGGLAPGTMPVETIRSQIAARSCVIALLPASEMQLF